MILLDANLLIYAVNENAPLHIPAKRWVESVLSGEETVGFASSVVLAFIRLCTRPGIFLRPLTVEEAFEIVTAWLDRSPVMFVQPGPAHLATLRALILPLGTGGNLTSDAHLAALAIEYGAILCSCDADFGRFAGLKWRNPLGSS